jgi:micrococcal nuclease
MNFQPSRFRAFVTRVIDGDTLHIMLLGTELTVRLLLVDTPETHKPHTSVQPFGPEAEAFTRRLVEGRLVEIERDIGGDTRDKYGRLLYYVYVDEKSLQEELLRRGLARVAYVFPPNVRYLDRYKEIQAEAMADGIGLWSPKNAISIFQ